MTSPKIGRTLSTRSVLETRRTRQTAKTPAVFSSVLRGTANVLLSGAKIASNVVGLPTLSATVSSASRLGSDVPAVSGGTTTQSTMEDIQKRRVEDDLKLLALQSQIQQQNRQVSLLSNVMKARHDTAKSAIGNIRS